MKVLIADDDSAARMALKRLVVRDFMAAVTEVDNGLDALDALSQQRYAFVLLDVQMPLMNGIETLSAIRSNPELVHLPVVVMSIIKDEAQVREIIKLGVVDYLVKPLRLSVVSERLAKLVQSLTAEEGSHAQASGFDPIGDGPMLLVDGDGDFRHYFVDTLSAKYPATAAESGAKALKLCLASPPRVLFVGSEIGALGPTALVQKIRSLPQLNATRLIAVAPQHLLQQTLASAPYDGGVPRSFVPETFRRSLARLFTQRGPLDRALAIYPHLRANIVSAAEQVCGMMMLIELQPHEPPKDWTYDMSALVTITLPDEAIELEFRIYASAASARQMTQRMLSGASDVSDADAASAMAEIANIITGRLHKGFQDHGTHVTCSLPTSESGTSAFGPAPDPAEHLMVAFRSQGEVSFVVELSANSSRGRQTTAPQQPDPASAIASAALAAITASL